MPSLEPGTVAITQPVFIHWTYSCQEQCISLLETLQPLLGSQPGVAELQLAGQIWLTNCFYKVLLEHNHTRLFTYCLWLFSCYHSKVE